MLETVRTFAALSEEFVEESLRLWPLRATAAGIHDYDHLLPDDTPDGFRARSAWLRDLEQRLAASVPWEELPTEHRVDYALLRSRLAVLRAECEEMRTYEHDPVSSLRTALDGVFLLVARPFAPLEERKEAIVARLMAIPEYLGAARATLARVPAVWVDLALEMADGGPIFVNEVVRTLLRAFPNESERIEHAGVRANAGLAAFREALERDLGGGADAGFALGERWLDFRLEREHMLPLGSSALERLAREQVSITRSVIENEAQRLGPGRPWRELVAEARARRAAGRGLRGALDAELARARDFVLERRLAPVPEVRLETLEMPAYLRPVLASVTCVAPAPFDLEPTGLLLVASPEIARAAGSRDGASPGLDPALVAAHEGWPGRHLQNALAIHCGSRLRRLAHSPLFAEGWAIHAEELMVGEGFGTGPDARLWLFLDLLADAGRAAVDMGLHSGRMELSQAVDFLVEEALLERPAALAEAKRATLAPGELLSGFTGRLQILELREEARRRLGARYDRLDFHAALLGGGTLPPALFREELWERMGAG
jgi:uncharacterized protein (DUF885 family)